ncbi:MAG: helix-turn-helix transcriptional regulator [Chloroflexi bacterium]|nr:helix-turn-helix transcriptional regulator [Chloroflexota bacterium]
MSTLLLKTKLYPPSTRSELVTRPRLIERLDAGLLGRNRLQKGLGFARKLTLVSAPAGFGKTTLIGDWLSGDERAFAWLSLDEGDNDLTRFLTYVVAALQQIDPNLGQTIQAVLQASQPPEIEPLITSLINEIAALDTRFVFVLDDYHAIKLTTIHETVTFLLDRMPSQMHLVIATREDPPVSISRLRVRRQMTEVRAVDLRFTEKEASAFLNQAMDLNLTLEDVAALEARTEGWIAGLQLAALSIQGERAEGISAFIKAFTGSHRYVVDYLAEEVLERQAPSTKAFLLQTSILNRLTGSLCDAVCSAGTGVTDQSGGQAMLEQLEEANLFLVPLDHERRWYRYHHLFADLLRNQLEVSQPDLVSTLHRRASVWYAGNGLMSKAIDHSLAVEDWERVTQLIDQHVNDVLGGNEYFTTVLDWLDAMPQEVIRANPRLGIVRAWMLMLMPRPDAAARCLQEIESAADGKLPDDIQLQVTAMRAFFARQQRDARKAIELSHQVFKALDEGISVPNLLRPMVALNLANAYRMMGDVPNAQHWFSEVLAITQGAGITLVLAVLSGQAATQILGGRSHQAAEIYQRGLQLADAAARQSGQIVPAASLVHTGLGDLLREWNKLDDAERHLAQGIELGQQGQVGMALCNGYIFQARLRQAQGDMAGALDLIQKAEQLPKAYRATPRYSEPVEACRARLMLAQAESFADDLKARNLAAVEQWAESRGFSADALPIVDAHICSADDEFEHLVWARLLIAQDKPNQALQLLAYLLQAAKEYGRTGRVIEMLILQALAHQALGDTKQALAALEQALSLAEPEGYVRLFVDEGTPMAMLLDKAVSRGIAPDYISKLQIALKAQDDMLSPQLSTSSVPPLLDPLTDRELDVLRLLSTDLSGPEIAEKLVVSANTIKTHIKRIYSKLDAHSRYEAIVRAKELGLL